MRVGRVACRVTPAMKRSWDEQRSTWTGYTGKSRWRVGESRDECSISAMATASGTANRRLETSGMSRMILGFVDEGQALACARLVGHMPRSSIGIAARVSSVAKY